MRNNAGRVRFVNLICKGNSRWVLLLICFLGIIIYILASWKVFRLGFPLDDAWIHQTYARNLIKNHEWAFILGKPSSGSTSPLWSILLSASFLVGNSPYIWTFFLGGVCLYGVAYLGSRWPIQTNIKIGGQIPLLSLFLAGEWHLVWSAASGMDTILCAFINLLFFSLLFSKQRKWVLLGLCVGLGIWVRPESLTLIGPAGFVFLLDKNQTETRIKNGFQFLLSAGSLIFLYLVFNKVLSDTWWPNTFFAKQAEYSIQLQIPLVNRLVSLFSQFLVGIGATLLPGFIWLSWRAVRKKNWIILSAILWWAGFTILYALRLPVIYQHGRYLIPAMPIFLLLAGSGTFDLWSKVQSKVFWQRIIKKGWISATILIWIIFFFMGMWAYAQDVAIIESEMVTTAHWVEKNTPENSIIAVHDIGAIGYFANRELVDLAGLVSPEIIPFIRDENQISIFLDQQKVDYLITFPNWYPILVHRGDEVFSTSGKFSPANGDENMVVYRWVKR